MAFKMAHADHRNIQGIGKCFCIVDPDEESAGQAGSLGDGDSGEIRPCETGLLQRLSGDIFNGFNVGTGGEFGDDATEALMNGMLRRNNVREHGSVYGKHRCRCFITRRLDTKDGPRHPGGGGLFNGRHHEIFAEHVNWIDETGIILRGAK